MCASQVPPKPSRGLESQHPQGLFADACSLNTALVNMTWPQCPGQHNSNAPSTSNQPGLWYEAAIWLFALSAGTAVDGALQFRHWKKRVGPHDVFLLRGTRVKSASGSAAAGWRPRGSHKLLHGKITAGTTLQATQPYRQQARPEAQALLKRGLDQGKIVT